MDGLKPPFVIAVSVRHSSWRSPVQTRYAVAATLTFVVKDDGAYGLAMTQVREACQWSPSASKRSTA
jgi:hypothetical protein